MANGIHTQAELDAERAKPIHLRRPAWCTLDDLVSMHGAKTYRCTMSRRSILDGRLVRTDMVAWSPLVLQEKIRKCIRRGWPHRGEVRMHPGSRGFAGHAR